MKYVVILTNSTFNVENKLELTSKPIFCESIGYVYEAIQESLVRPNTVWSVWEIVNDKPEYRTVNYPYDMQRISIF